MTTAHCCYIPDEEQGKPSPKNCPKPAEWNIHTERVDPPSGGTQACTDHVGAMLQTGYNAVWPVDP